MSRLARRHVDVVGRSSKLGSNRADRVAQPDALSTRAHLRVVADTLRQRFPAATAILDDAEANVTAYADFPRPITKRSPPPTHLSGCTKRSRGDQRGGHLPRRRLGGLTATTSLASVARAVRGSVTGSRSPAKTIARASDSASLRSAALRV